MKDTKELTRLADELAGLTVAELQEFKTILKDKYGLEETKPVVVEAVKAEEVKEEKKSSFNVTLTNVSGETSKKLTAVKAINRFTGVGLQPAMALTKEIPSLLKENVPAAEAEAFKEELAALDCTVELS
jgi:large subunit ribosomal protein L7/L12